MGYWLVGEAPTKQTVDNPEAMLTPDDTGMPNLANRLLDLTGWTIGQFVSVFDVRTTVWKRHWPMWLDEGRQNASVIGEAAKGAPGVVLVGQMAAAAFGLDGEALFEWFGRYSVIPNPAPTRLMRYRNIPGLREKARDFFDQILKRHHELPKRTRARPARPRPRHRRA